MGSIFRLKFFLSVALLCFGSTVFGQGVSSYSDVAEDIKKEREVLEKTTTSPVLKEVPSSRPFTWLPWVLGTLTIFFMARAIFKLNKIVKTKRELLQRLKYEDDYNELVRASREARDRGRPLTKQEKEAFSQLTDRLLNQKNETPLQQVAKEKFKQQLNEELRKKGLVNRERPKFSLIDGGRKESGVKEERS